MLCFFVDVQNKIKTFIDPYLVSLRGFAPVDYFRVLSSVPCSYSGPLRMICFSCGPGLCALIPPCLAPPESHDSMTLATGCPVRRDQEAACRAR